MVLSCRSTFETRFLSLFFPSCNTGALPSCACRNRAIFSSYINSVYRNRSLLFSRNQNIIRELGYRKKKERRKQWNSPWVYTTAQDEPSLCRHASIWAFPKPTTGSPCTGLNSYWFLNPPIKFISLAKRTHHLWRIRFKRKQINRMLGKAHTLCLHSTRMDKVELVGCNSGAKHIWWHH